MNIQEVRFKYLVSEPNGTGVTVQYFNSSRYVLSIENNMLVARSRANEAKPAIYVPMSNVACFIEEKPKATAKK